MITVIVIAALIVIAFLGWNLAKRFASDRLQGFGDRRRGSSRLVSRGEFVDGMRHMPVSLALGASALYYENSDMEASLDLDLIHEVEYDAELATGAHIGDGSVLRLRCNSQVFEFVLPADALAQWKTALPATH